MFFRLVIFFTIFSSVLFALDGASTKKLDDIIKKLDKSNLREYELHNIQNEINRAHNEDRFIKLNNLLLNIDTENKILKEQIKHQSRYTKKTLEIQQKNYETELKQQTIIYKTELEQQTLIYGIAFGGLTMMAFIANFIGFRKLQKYTNKIVKNEHADAINEITEKLSTDISLQNRIESIVRIELEKQGSAF